MAEIVYGDHAISEPLQELADLLRADKYEGTLYIGYPILTNVEGTVRVDALYLSADNGVVIFDATHLALDPRVDENASSIVEEQDRYYAAINSKLLESPDLLQRRQLVVPINTITLSSSYDAELENGGVVSTVENLTSNLHHATSVPPDKYRILKSVIERTATIRPKKKRANVEKETSKGSALKRIERNIANLDAWQKRAAIEVPLGPQRIRGLAGSGKTIVLALKAAYLHTKEPNSRIALTFQTRSLYQQFLRLVRQFCFEFSKQEPDWSRLSVLHAWGSISYKGVYSEVSKAVNEQPIDFQTAKSRYGLDNAFGGTCSSLLSKVKSIRDLEPIYDVVLIDEAQDFPQSFFELVYYITRDPKRIVYAYDELQNLSDYTMKPAEDLFGRRADGSPNVHLRNEVGKPKRDIILPVCYRNTPWALTTAHSLGFGTARSGGLVQMFDEPTLWSDIGYDVTSGSLTPGNRVSLKRSHNATPDFFLKLLDADTAVSFHSFNTIDEEMKWLAESIHKNLKDDEIETDDILIVVPEALTIRSTAPKIMRALRKKEISSHLVGVTTSRDEVFLPDSIAITSIYRAKGNEAPMIYVVGADYCVGGFNLARKRSILFTAITRSRAWVRVSGTGADMQSLIEEYNHLKNDGFELRFLYPNSEELRKLRTINRDRSSDEIAEIQNDISGLTRIAERIRSGQISIESLPTEVRDLLR